MGGGALYPNTETGGPRRAYSPRVDATDAYLEHLKRALTGTLAAEAPDHDDPDVARFIRGFIAHYVRGDAVTMLPAARLDNIRSCVERALSEGVAGDLIECGAWRGGATIFMRALLKARGAPERRVWVADSFQGLPEPDGERFPREAAAHQSRTMVEVYRRFAVPLEEVKANFARFGLLDEGVRFLPGWFEETLPAAPIEELALLRIDGDYYASTRQALESLYPKVSAGGYVIVDDYGEDAWTHCRRAVDEFRREAGIADELVAVDSKCVFWRRGG